MATTMSISGHNHEPRNLKNIHLNLCYKLEKHCFIMWGTLFQVYTKYHPIQPIGKGAYGVVCSAIDTETTQKVAIKKINSMFLSRVGALRILRELVILRHAKHPNVVTLKDVMLGNSVYMVLELMDTDLDRLIVSSGPLPNKLCKFFLYQLLKGLQFLHSAGILHRDLKPGNLLLNAKGVVKIADFGLATTLAGGSGGSGCMAEYVVSRWYRAPEVLLGCTHGTAIDIWSAGCIFGEMLAGKPVFPGCNSHSQLSMIVGALGTQPESSLGFVDNQVGKMVLDSLPRTQGMDFGCLFPLVEPLAVDLLEKMLCFDPRKRITAAEALRQPYLLELYDPVSDSPGVAAAPLRFDVGVDDDLDGETIRKLVWGEMLRYHPEEGYFV